MDDGGVATVLTLTGTQVAMIVGALLGGGTTAIAFILKFRKLVSKVMHLMEHFADDWTGVPDRDGVRGRPGMMLRVAQLEENQDRMAHQITEIMGVVRGGVVLLPTTTHNNEIAGSGQ